MCRLTLPVSDTNVFIIFCLTLSAGATHADLIMKIHNAGGASATGCVRHDAMSSPQVRPADLAGML